jgi:hypothetical protein
MQDGCLRSVTLALVLTETRHAYIIMTDNELQHELEWRSKILSVSQLGGRNVAA